MRWYRHFVLKKTDNAWGMGDAAAASAHRGLDSSSAACLGVKVGLTCIKSVTD